MQDGNDHLEPDAGEIMYEPYSHWQLAWWALTDWCFSTLGDVTAGLMMVMQGLIFYAVHITGIGVLAVAGAFFLAGALVWQHFSFLRGFARRNVPLLMGIRFRFIKALWCGWWLLKKEITDLHNRFRECKQSGDMMVDFENVYSTPDEYFTEGQFPVGASAISSPGLVVEEDEPMQEQENSRRCRSGRNGT